MATRIIEVYGTIEWARVFPFNRDKGKYDVETDGATKVTVVVDKENQSKIKSSGSSKKPNLKRLEEDGELVYTFKRPWHVEGREWASGAPEVYRADGTPWNSDTDGLIGNGSKGIVFVEVFPAGDGVGTRLRGLQVIDHVPYETDYDPETASESSHLNVKDRSGGGSKSASKQVKPSKPPVDDDEIPF